MERVNQKLTILFEALKTLAEGIQLFDEYEKIAIASPTTGNTKVALGMRDSMIQRFEYCTDLFWKSLKFYLEITEKIDVIINSPRGIIREATKAKFLSEDEGDDCIKMIECRNRTSHAYHVVMAEQIAAQIPQYYDLIKTIADRVSNPPNN